MTSPWEQTISVLLYAKVLVKLEYKLTFLTKITDTKVYGQLVMYMDI